MILVRNLLLPLNGSRCLLGLSVLVLLAACTPKVRVLRAPGSDVPVKTEKPTEEEETTGKSEEADAIDFNQIALLLPFELDKANPHAPSAADIKRSAMALDFYQGYKIGLDALSAESANFKLNVLDSRDDAAENARIPKLHEVQDAALVMGPVCQTEVAVFDFNAKLGQMLQLSPLAASMPSEFTFANTFTRTAPLRVQVKELDAHIAEQEQAGDVVIFYPARVQGGKQLLAAL